MKLNNDFVQRFTELKEGYYEIRKRLHGEPIDDKESLKDQLWLEIERHEPWRKEIMGDLGEITANFNKVEKANHQQHIRRSRYFEYALEAPFYHRIITKPNGYAGDAEMMRIIYDNDFEGDTPFGMFLHKHATSTAACQAVRNRKAFLVEEIRKVGSGKILSFAAGPIEEIKQVLCTNQNCDYEFLALDHDISVLKQINGSICHPKLQYALANAFRIIKGDYRIAQPKRFLEKYCDPAEDFKGFKKLICSMKYKYDTLRKDEYDLVYTAGLYDYIQTFPNEDRKGTIALTANLFKLVKPGGTLIIGNFSPNNPKDLLFPMEYIYDWNLIYRTKEEIIDFIKTIPESNINNVELLQEPLGINYFLKIQKK